MEAEKLAIAEEVRAQQELAIGMPPSNVTDGIDVICHELRNPLNGIYHNADILVEMGSSIRDIIQKFRDELLVKHNTDHLSSVTLGAGDTKPVTDLIEFLEIELEQGLESLESLNLCAKHQKRIADDVLQMSKLSMNLVSLTESAFDPLVETSNVIRMFEREAFVKKIDFKFTLGTAYRDLDIRWVTADPIRFSQVLVNFISNAVRFTEKSTLREIEVILDAAREEPSLPNSLRASTDTPPHRFQPAASEEENEKVYLIASVADSGVGLTPEERSNLFRKFAQASPRTHIEYGGSGLGLFISKALVEVQGGRIALESEKNKGTTFTFYIQATQVEKPVQSTPANKSRSVSPKVLTPRIRRSLSSTSSIPQAKKGNVLVVEDNLVPLASGSPANLD
jgi:signal transduction histidine kinase